LLDQYRETEIRTASPEMLVVKMYEGAIRFARQAVDMNEAGRLVERGTALSRCMAIVSELRNSLDHEQGAEISANLERLYNFVSERLLEGNLQGRSESIREAVRVLEILLTAWVEIANGPRRESAP
jgi:flagellar protein FliS